MEMVPSPVESMPSDLLVDANNHLERTESGPHNDFPTATVEGDKTGDTFSPPSVTSPSALVPSLKGSMTHSGGLVVCKGKWAMSDAQHDIDGQSSDFEFRLVKADQGSGSFPINGKYQGWFLIKQAPPLKGIKVDDRDMMMKFIPNDDQSTFTVTGQGHNRLGKFNLRGSLTNDGSVHIYREYYQLAPVPTPSQQKKATTPAKPKDHTDRKAPATAPLPPSVEVPPPASSNSNIFTPREGSGRVRKLSSLLQDFHDTSQKPIVRTASRDVASSSGAQTPSAIVTPRIATVTTERTHRLSSAMKKCQDLLKELSKLHQAQWFLEPVDPIKYNIPDYPKIIKNPMDFSTIRKNLENGVYDSINAFAEHMRLVFRNAITYNAARDSLVNIAAREISSRFEDKFRMLVTQLDPATMSLMDQPKAGKLTGIKRSKSRDFASVRAAKMPPGPRALTAHYSLPPAAVDGSTYKILEMQQIIANMQDELKQLRTVVKESEISKKLNESKEAAQNPLTFEEKKSLVGQIHKLSADKMERVLSIIQEAMPNCGEGTVEVPIDSLDTLTLRKLQSFVALNTQDRKKRQYSIKTDGSNKRPRKARIPKASISDSNLYQSQPSHDQQDIGYLEGDDDLLFETDSFEDIVPKDEMDETMNEHDSSVDQIMAEYEKLKQKNNVFIEDPPNENPWTKSQSNNSNEFLSNNPLDSPHDGLTSSGNDVEEEDNENLWNEATAEMQNNKPQYDVYQV